MIASLAEARVRALALLDAQPPLLVVTDFDGTLAPIHPDPTGARIEPLGRTALRRLARLSRAAPGRLRVFVLSGRGALDVASRVRVGGLAYFGNHGLERGDVPTRGRPETLEVSFDQRLVPYEAVVRRLGGAVAARLGEPAWLYVEVKGPSIAFHFRQAADPAGAFAAIEEALAAVEPEIGAGGLERFEGRKVVEFRPAGAGGKAAALDRLLGLERPGAALILGDDRSDAEAFGALAKARSTGRLAGLAVGVHGAVETPPEILAAADLVLGSPRDAARLLSALGREIERRQAPS